MEIGENSALSGIYLCDKTREEKNCSSKILYRQKLKLEIRGPVLVKAFY